MDAAGKPQDGKDDRDGGKPADRGFERADPPNALTLPTPAPSRKGAAQPAHRSLFRTLNPPLPDGRPGSTARARRLERDLTDHLYAQIHTAFLGQILAIVFAVALLQSFLPPGLIATWSSAMIAAACLRLLLKKRFDQKKKLQIGPRDRFWFDIGIVATGAAWSSGVLAAIPFLGPAERAFLLLVLAGILAGGLATVSGFRRSSLLFQATMIGPACVAFFLEPGPRNLRLGIISTVFLIYCISAASKARKILVNVFEAGFENEEMVQSLARAKLAAENAVETALEASRLKSEFLANMSHEIRTPLNGVLGMTELILDSRLDSEQKEFATTLHRSGEILLELINDILDFSKIEAGKLSIERIEFDLVEALDDVADLHAPRALSKGVDFILDLDSALPDRLLGDPVRIRQVVHNLVGNAIKFTEKGSITLSAWMGPEEEGNAILHLEVRDTGVGIPPERRQKIFESFTQADGSTTRKFGGTGLGLTITRRILDLMHGSIEVESEVGRGTRFQVLLPVHSMAGPCPTWLEDQRLLLLMPEGEVRNALVRRLEGLGAIVETGESLPGPGQSPAAPGQHLSWVLGDHHLLSDPESRKQFDSWCADRQAGRVVLIQAERREAGRGFERILPAPFLRRKILSALGLSLPEGGSEARSEPVPGPGRPVPESAHGAPEVLPAQAPSRILVAEDNATNRKLIKVILERLGCSPTLVQDGAEALALIREGSFDLVLMDVQMPVMDGFQATRAIRELEEALGTARIPIVALTAHAMEGDRERCLEAGMDDYLTKPVRRERLKALLEQWRGSAAPVRG